MIAIVAEVNIEYAVEDYCINNSSIKSAAVMEYNNTLIVAVMTKPIFTRSERQRVLNSLSKDIGERYCRKVIVTADLEVYSKIVKYHMGRDINPQEIVEIVQRRTQ